MRRTIHDLLDGEKAASWLGRIIITGSVLVVLASVAVTLMATDAAFAEYVPLFHAIQLLCLIVFTLEWVLRIWIAPESRRRLGGSAAAARLHYLLSPRGLIDFLAIAPFWIAPALGAHGDWLWHLQILRVLKLMRYSSALETLGSVIRTEARPLIAAMVVMVTLLVLFSTALYLVEHQAQPEKFSSSLAALWWGVVTLATVGYGDVVPITGLGRVIGGFAVLLGLGMFALPAAILASGFAEEVRKRNFVVTWNLVARVPLFANLPAMRIADIAAMLKPRSAERGDVIVRKGDKADCMYVLVSGSAEVRIEPPVRLSAGDFFGEIALLIDVRRTADVLAVTFCQLLMLPVSDFRNLLQYHPDIEAQLRKVAQERLGETFKPKDTKSS